MSFIAMAQNLGKTELKQSSKSPLSNQHSAMSIAHILHHTFRPKLRGVMHLVWFLSTPIWTHVLLSACPPTLDFDTHHSSSPPANSEDMESATIQRPTLLSGEVDEVALAAAGSKEESYISSGGSGGGSPPSSPEPHPRFPLSLLGDGPKGACLLFMFCWALQYGASALWHRWPWSKREHEILANHFDHVGIFVMIAGSYTVPCALALPQTGHSLACGLWFVALVGR